MLEQTIDLMTPSYEKGLKTILKEFEAFCVKHDIVADIELERKGNTIEAQWLIYYEAYDTIHEVYKKYQAFAESCEDEVELLEVVTEDDGYHLLFGIKRFYILSV